MIVFNNVTKYFPTRNGRKYILRDVSFTLKTGENVGVIGPNGAGKTTMMRLICGVDIPNSGQIETTYFLSWPMGIAGGMQGAMSGCENAKFVCRILGEPEDKIPEKLNFIQEFAEIGNDFDLPVINYSSGMRARLNFAISMGFKFDCYVVDELTAVGDQRFREKSAKFFKDKREEACFIKVSHNMNELKAECDSALFIMEGKLYYFPEVVEGIDAYQAVLKGDAPSTLDDHLVSKPHRANGQSRTWFNPLASVDLKAPLLNLKAQGRKLKARGIDLREHGSKLSIELREHGSKLGTDLKDHGSKLKFDLKEHGSRLKLDLKQHSSKMKNALPHQEPKIVPIPPPMPAPEARAKNGGAEADSRRPIAPPAMRAIPPAAPKRKTDRLAQATDVLERMLERKKIIPPG